MTNEIQILLQVSASLYAKLGELPSSETRDTFVEEISMKLDSRSKAIQKVLDGGFKYNPSEKSHSMLMELDKGIKERLQTVMVDIKKDLKDIQNSKKNEQQYANPYGHVQVMDGMYYDKKK